MNAQRIERFLRDEILSACPELAAAEVTADASLTGHLGLDSLALSSLFSAIKMECGHLELAPWFISASNNGTDTVGSLARFIAARLEARIAA